MEDINNFFGEDVDPSEDGLWINSDLDESPEFFNRNVQNWRKLQQMFKTFSECEEEEHKEIRKNVELALLKLKLDKSEEARAHLIMYTDKIISSSEKTMKYYQDSITLLQETLKVSELANVRQQEEMEKVKRDAFKLTKRKKKIHLHFDEIKRIYEPSLLRNVYENREMHIGRKPMERIIQELKRDIKFKKNKKKKKDIENFLKNEVRFLNTRLKRCESEKRQIFSILKSHTKEIVKTYLMLGQELEFKENYYLKQTDKTIVLKQLEMVKNENLKLRRMNELHEVYISEKDKQIEILMNALKANKNGAMLRNFTLRRICEMTEQLETENGREIPTPPVTNINGLLRPVNRPHLKNHGNLGECNLSRSSQFNSPSLLKFNNERMHMRISSLMNQSKNHSLIKKEDLIDEVPTNIKPEKSQNDLINLPISRVTDEPNDTVDNDEDGSCDFLIGGLVHIAGLPIDEYETLTINNLNLDTSNENN